MILKSEIWSYQFHFLNTLDSFKNTVSTIRARFEIDDNGSLEDRQRHTNLRFI